MTDAARECCGAKFDEHYSNVREFVRAVFPDESQERILGTLLEFGAECDRILCEEKARNGKWLRVSLSHAGTTDRFAMGFLEDITVLREAEERSERRSEIIESLSSEYYALYIVNLKHDRISPYLLRNDVAKYYAKILDDGMSYSEWLERYCSTYVVGEDRDDVCRLFDKQHVMESLPDKGGDFSVVCKRLFDDEPQYIELRLIQLADDANEFVLAARNVNDEMREQIVQKEALQSALALAQHASEAKTTFLTNISHDFRTPLNSIMGFANLALARPDDPERVRDSLEKILLSSEHLLDLINDILDVSRIESGKIVIDEQAIDLNTFLDELRNVFMVQAVQNSIDFRVDDSKLVHRRVVGDQLRMNRDPGEHHRERAEVHRQRRRGGGDGQRRPHRPERRRHVRVQREGHRLRHVRRVHKPHLHALRARQRGGRARRRGNGPRHDHNQEPGRPAGWHRQT